MDDLSLLGIIIHRIWLTPFSSWNRTFMHWYEINPSSIDLHKRRFNPSHISLQHQCGDVATVMSNEWWKHVLIEGLYCSGKQILNHCAWVFFFVSVHNFLLFKFFSEPVINTVMNEIKKFTTQSQFTVQYTVTYTDVFDFFEFTLQNETDTSLVQKDKLNSNQTAVFSGLQSGRVYTVEAVTISNQVRSDPISMQIVTGERKQLNIVIGVLLC